MAGIDSIIDRILKDARESADARVARAEQDAEKLIAKKKDQAKEEEEKMLADAQKVIDAQVRQNQATQNTKSQRRLLAERVALIDEIVEEAKKRIRNLPSEDRLRRRSPDRKRKGQKRHHRCFSQGTVFEDQFDDHAVR